MKQTFPILPVLLALLMTLVALPSFAQDTPRAELFAGYSALITRSEKAELDDGISTLKVKRETAYVNGWNASIAVNANSWLGFVGDFSGHYGPVDYQGTYSGNKIILGSQTRVHHYLGGPQFSVRGESARFFVRALIGGVTVNESFSHPDLNFNESYTVNGLAAGAGIGFDIRISDRLAWRAIQADYLWYRFGQPKLIINGTEITNSATQNNFRISSGLVFSN